MARTTHSWNTTHAAFGRRFTFGLVVAMALSLVAFEWQGQKREVILPYEPLPMEDDMEFPRVIVLAKEPSATLPAAKRRVAHGAIVPSAEPLTPVDPAPPLVGSAEPGEPAPEPGEVTTLPSRDEGPPETFFMANVGVRPYFMECLKEGVNALDACTEARIQRHLERRFKIPASIRGEVRTTVTFEIDRSGRIGRLVCAPRVSLAVEEEIERVLRLLPDFVPGSQGGIPVPVYYQIPLRVRSI